MILRIEKIVVRKAIFPRTGKDRESKAAFEKKGEFLQLNASGAAVEHPTRRVIIEEDGTLFACDRGELIQGLNSKSVRTGILCDIRTAVDLVAWCIRQGQMTNCVSSFWIKTTALVDDRRV